MTTLDDSELSIPIYSPVCVWCRHLDLTKRRSCAAFPAGIPMPIWMGTDDHTIPHEGDNGIQFERVERP